MKRDGTNRGISVSALIEQLKTFPPDAEVYSEGCDCVGEAKAAVYDPDDKTVTIARLD